MVLLWVERRLVIKAPAANPQSRQERNTMKGNRVALDRLYLPPQDIGSLSGTMRLMAQYTCLRKGHDAYKIIGFEVCRRCWKIMSHPESRGKMNITEDQLIIETDLLLKAAMDVAERGRQTAENSGNGSGERFNVIRKLLKQCRELHKGFIRPLYPKKEEKVA
jgi:hypothetical protein